MRSGKCGGQQRYPDLSIETCLTLRAVFGLPLGQTQGFVRSLLRLMQTDLPVPDFSTLCRRVPSLQIALDTLTASDPIGLVLNGTGLRVHGCRDWMWEKHGLPKARKIWRKLHIGFDLESGALVASCLTPQQIGDTGALPDLLVEVSALVRCVIGNGAYDGVPTAAAIQHAFGPGCRVDHTAAEECFSRGLQGTQRAYRHDYLNWPTAMAEGHRLWSEVTHRGRGRALQTSHRTGTAQQ